MVVYGLDDLDYLSQKSRTDVCKRRRTKIVKGEIVRYDTYVNRWGEEMVRDKSGWRTKHPSKHQHHHLPQDYFVLDMVNPVHAPEHHARQEEENLINYVVFIFVLMMMLIFFAVLLISVVPQYKADITPAQKDEKSACILVDNVAP